jgi:hypothetical protein
MALEPIGSSSSLSSLFSPQSAGPGGLARLFGSQEESGSLSRLFSSGGTIGGGGAPAKDAEPLKSIFAPREPDSLELFKGFAEKAANFQTSVLTAINTPLVASDTSILSFFPPINAGPEAPGISLPGQQPAGSINAVSFLQAFYQPQFDLIGDVIDALS